ncbi:MAG: hypothetical protein MJ182_01845 [Treponema sp.]|nr:hypothetical protein [Treponema sp.]
MSLISIILLILDMVCLAAAIVVFLVFTIRAVVLKIKKQKAKPVFMKGLLYTIYCFMGCVVITWIMKMGLSIIGKIRAA